MQEVRKTCSRVVIINEGRIVADGSVDALVAGHGGARVMVELEAPADAATEAMGGLSSVARADAVEADAGGRARFAVEGAPGQDPRPDISRLAAARDWPLWELHLAQASLEDLFHRLTAESAGPADETTVETIGEAPDETTDETTEAGEEVDG